MLSVIVPTLNAGRLLPACLAALAPGWEAGLVGEVVVVDGGSDDDTRQCAEDAGARFIPAPRGRGQQLSHGALRAEGEWFLFLHADTVLMPEWLYAAEAFMDDPGSSRRAGYFGFRLDDDTPAARRLERLVAWRCRRLGLPYGDQGLLLSRQFYGEVGGYRPLPLMEDVDLVRRIGRRRLTALGASAVTSAERYRRDGYAARSLRNLFCLSLYFLGVSPRRLLGLYR